jgi:hypothetical protein
MSSKPLAKGFMLEGIAHRTLFPLPPVRGFSKRVAGLQDKQNKSTARTAINGKKQIEGLVSFQRRVSHF